MKSEKQYITEFAIRFISPIERLTFESEVSFIDFLILDKQTQRYKMLLEFKKDLTSKEKMFEQLRRTKGVVMLGDGYKGLFGAVNKTHFYVKDNDWNDLIEFELTEVEPIKKWLENNLVEKDEVVNWSEVFYKCGFVLDEDLFDNTITYEKVLSEKNKYLQSLFVNFTKSFGGVNVDLSFAEMFLNELGVSNSLSKYKNKGLEFAPIVFEDGYKDYLQMHYQELIMEKHQRKLQGAYYTKLNVTALMWEMIRKHINIDDYIIWDPCCGTGNLFLDTDNSVFDFLNKDNVYLSDIDPTAIDLCKQSGFNAENVFGYDYQNTLPSFNDEQCFRFDYQDTIIDKFINMPHRLRKIIQESPHQLLVVCNPPYLGGSMVRLEGAYDIIYGTMYKYAKANNWMGYKSNDIFQQCYKQFMVWCNEKQIRKAKKCYIVPISWTTAIGCGNTGEVFRQKLNQNFIDAFMISNCEFENVNRFDPIGVFLVGNDKGEYDWKNIKIPVYLPEDEKSRVKFIKEMNKINAKYDLKKHLPKLEFEFEK